MNKSLNILQICPRIPFPPDDGGKIGIYNITKHLAQRGHRITMLTFSMNSELPEEMMKYAEVVTVRHDTRTTMTGLIRNLFSGLPYTVSKYLTPQMEEQLRTLCRRQAFDIVHVDHSHLAPYGKIAKEEFRLPYCLREHNFETTIYERFADAHGFSLLKHYLRMQARRIRRFEKAQLDQTDLCMAITEQDAANIRAESAVSIRIIPAGVDLEKHGFLPREKERPRTILILGSMAWQPNTDAVKWFLDEVFPLVLRIAPDAVVTIAGMSPGKDIRSRANQNILVPGFIENLQERIAETQVLAIPLRIGGGMRIKMLEFFAYGKPVVSTGIGAEGNTATAGRHYLKADTAEEFADAILALFEAKQKREQLGDSARVFVEENYSWNSIAAQFEAAYYVTIDSNN
jgi:polysaccharide biosynthesis protein PslH